MDTVCHRGLPFTGAEGVEVGGGVGVTGVRLVFSVRGLALEKTVSMRHCQHPSFQRD